LGISSVIIEDLDMIWTSLCPYKTNPPLLIDPNTVLSHPITLKSFKTIVWRYGEIPEHLGVVQHPQFRSAVCWISCGKERLNGRAR